MPTAHDSSLEESFPCVGLFAEKKCYDQEKMNRPR